MLLDITHDAAATLELQPLVGLILDRVKEVVDYTGAALFVLDDSGEGLNLLRYQGPIPQHTLAYRWSLATHPHAREVVTRARPVIINDVYSDHPLAEAFRRASTSDLGEMRADFGSWMGVPMMLRDRVIGMLSVEIEQINYYTGRHGELLLAVADHAAMAVENARLYERARGLAALEERQKLARELHDSVSQALFGIGLGARTARALLDRDPSKVADPLDYVVSLAEAALTEMRALIFELRPDALQQDGLVGILDKQAAALAARHKLDIKTDLGTEPEATFEVKEALYRIGQEALHNAVKHAHASTIWVSLNQAGQSLTLEIVDNGVGFDPEGAFPGHLGLQSMRERAARMGAVIEVESAPGQGSRLSVVVPPAK
jgi:signal transduction histidine kinase